MKEAEQEEAEASKRGDEKRLTEIFFFTQAKRDRDRATWFGLNPVVTAPTSQWKLMKETISPQRKIFR